MKSFGESIKNYREGKGLLLREVASAILIDPALLSKIERNERNATREQVERLAQYFNQSQDDFIRNWLSDKISQDLQEEKFAEEILTLAVKKVGLRKRN